MKIARSASTKAKKGAKWKRGAACISNPSKRRFRDAVKSGTFKTVVKESGLTADALSVHNAKLGSADVKSILRESEGRSEDSEVEDARSAALTWATDFSACTNMSFNRLLTNWDPSSELHKEMLAVLAAVTECIKESKGQETDSEYLGALLTSLSDLKSDMTTTAKVVLINMVIKRVPPSLIRHRFADIARQLYKLLEEFEDSEHNALLCGLINISSYVCKQQDIRDTSQWTDPESTTSILFTAILTYISHPKPRVRRAAQKNICGIMRSSPNHPSAMLCGIYVTDKLEEFRKTGNNASLLSILNFLSYGLALLPPKSIKSVAENILKAMTGGDPYVMAQGLVAISNMFMYESTQLVIKAELNAKLLNALYDFQPEVHDTPRLSLWVMVMLSALTHLHKANVNLFAMNVGKFVSVATNVFLCENEAVHTATEKVLRELLSLCSATEQIMETLPGSQVAPAEKIIAALEGTLKYQFHSAWGSIFAVWGTAFTSLAKFIPDRLVEVIPTLADLRETDGFEYVGQVDRAIGAAVESLGPRKVLEKVPLNITGVNDDDSFPRSWLLPILRDHIRETELKFFIEYFFPFAGNLSKAETKARNEGKKHLEVCYRALGNQVWSLLPAFCTKTSDVEETFPKVAQTLGVLLSAKPERRLPVLSALRKLIATSPEPERTVGRYAKNYLPILCNIYVKKDEPERLAAYDTIRSFVAVTDQELACNVFKTAMTKIRTTEGDDAEFVRMAATDITRALLPRVTEAEGKDLYEHCIESLKNGPKAMQKKAYLTLEDLFRAECCHEFVEKQLDDLQLLLVTSISKVSNAAKAPRLRCIKSVLSSLSSPSEKFVVSVIPEAVLCCREPAAKIKQAALEVIVECADALQRWSIPNAFQQYISLLMGGLAGSPTSISAAVTAIAHCIRHYKEHLVENEQLLRQLVEAVCTLVVSPTREIVKSALEFIKGLFTLIEIEQLAKYADLIIERVCNMTADCGSHFRVKVKGILVRFVRRFGFELVDQMVPESHKKVLNNIRKIENRRRKGNSMASASTGNDSDDEDAKTVQSRRRQKEKTFEDMLGSDSDDESDQDSAARESAKRKKKRGVWLKENEGEIVDLMDPSAMKNISSTDPEKYRQKVAQRLSAKEEAEQAGFKLTEDGKLLITNDMIDKEDKRGKKRAREQEDSDLEDIDDLLGALSGYAKSSKPRSVKSTNTMKSAKSTASVGNEYRSKKAKGDVKSKGQRFDPYAYIPMSRSTLNKRKRAKLSGQFNSVVKSASKGARKGMKQRSGKKSRKIMKNS
ncbi:RRP12-like protein [Galendromus occidentalis]|uniref:RRP12-like protein n=1 Tax=Galendromus occidentalis TaxID=34638 RepID=A0AAJ6QNM3_9ACAR|nr:RRP12-like protein [Galendromus occidentalis]